MGGSTTHASAERHETVDIFIISSFNPETTWVLLEDTGGLFFAIFISQSMIGSYNNENDLPPVRNVA